MSQAPSSGLLAIGSAGKWSIDIHEETNRERWLFSVVVAHPMMTLQFSVQDLAVLSRLMNFLEAQGGGKGPDDRFTVTTSLGEAIHFITTEGQLLVRILGHDELGGCRVV